MSIKVMSWIWEHSTASGGELLVLLAMADFADDNGENIYPSMETLAKKARMSSKQARRVVHQLIAAGLVELVREGGWDNGRNRSNEYRILLVGTPKMSAPPKMSGTPKKGRGGTPADGSTVLPPMGEDPSYIRHIDPSLTTDDEDKRAAHGAVFRAWSENIPGTMTPILGEKLHDLIDECGPQSVIHGITTSVEAGARNFKYIAACARNHAAGKEPPAKVPPASRRAAPVSKVAGSMAAVDEIEAMLREGKL